MPEADLSVSLFLSTAPLSAGDGRVLPARAARLVGEALETTLARLAGDHGDVVRLELGLLRSFRKYALSDAHCTDTIWHWAEHCVSGRRTAEARWQCVSRGHADGSWVAVVQEPCIARKGRADHYSDGSNDGLAALDTADRKPQPLEPRPPTSFNISRADTAPALSIVRERRIQRRRPRGVAQRPSSSSLAATARVELVRDMP